MAQGDIKQVTNNSGKSNNIYYCKMPDGTLIQWGKGTISGGSGSVTFTLPVSFVDTAYAVVASPDIVTSSSGVYGTGATFPTQITAVNQVRVHRSNSSATYDNYVYFIAIGRWK